jgi:hypothetical protein
MARSARCDVRWQAAVFVEPDETAVSEDLLHSDAFRRPLLQIGGANITAARIAPARSVSEVSPSPSWHNSAGTLQVLAQ